MFALVVRFEVQSNHGAAFDALVEATVAEIAAHEPGTLAYVTHTRADRPNERIFYECYRDIAAFEAHERFEHTRSFLRERTQYLAAEPEVWRLTAGAGAIEGATIGAPGKSDD